MIFARIFILICGIPEWIFDKTPSIILAALGAFSYYVAIWKTPADIYSIIMWWVLAVGITFLTGVQILQPVWWWAHYKVRAYEREKRELEKIERKTGRGDM